MYPTLLRLNLRAAITSAFLLAAIGSGMAFAQPGERTIAQYVHTAWGEKEGAPKAIWAFAQTPDSFLWIASNDGLTRFDGLTFEQYEPPSGPALPAGFASSLLELPNGDLWIGFNHRAITLLRAGRAVNYALPEGMPNASVRSLAQDGVGTLWAATSGGLARFDGNRWVAAGKDWNFPEGAVRALFLDSHGTMWAATEHTILSLPKGAHAFQLTSIAIGTVPQIAEARNGKLWIDEGTRSVRPMPLGTSALPSDESEIRVGSVGILFARDGGLWVTSQGDGLRLIPDPEKLQGKPGPADPSIDSYTDKDGLTDKSCMRAFEDREGNIWVGTLSGLDRFRKGALVPIVSSFSSNVSTLLPADGGDIWINANIGLVRVHDSRLSLLGDTSPTLELKEGVYGEPPGAIWGMTTKRLLRHEKDRVTQLPLPAVLADAFDNRVTQVAFSKLRDGVLWLAVREAGLFYQKLDTWNRFPTPPELAKLSPGAAFIDDSGRAWFGYDEGRIIYVDHREIHTVATQRDAPVGNVRVIRGSNQQLWIGGSAGLAFSDGKRVLPVVPSDAAAFGYVSGIEQTADGSLWLREARGVVHLGPEQLRRFLQDPTYRVHYDLYDSSDGLPGRFEHGPAYEETVDSIGRLWFASTKGYVSLDPANLPKNSPPPAAIRTVIADGKPFPPQDGMTLPPLTGRLTIGYSGLNLSSPSKVRLRYEMEGTDKGWQDAGASRQAFYTTLAPGKHRFRLNARNEGGEWNEQDTVLDFTVVPAWFQTIWFRTLCAAVALFLVWALYRIRVRQVARAMSTRFDERLAERTRIARDLHDTFLQTIQGSKLVVDSALKQSTDPSPMRSSMEQVSVWLGRATEEGRAALNSLRTSATEKNDLAAAFRRAIEECRMQSSMETSLTVIGQVSEMHPIVRDEVYRIGYEAIRNACVHSQAANLEVELTYAEDLILRVRDNGVGMDPAIADGGREGHFGLEGMRERANRILAKFSVETSPAAGTEIKLVVPGSIIYRKPMSDRRKLSAIRSLLEKMGLKSNLPDSRE